MFSSSLTLLLITPERLVRADVSGGSAAQVTGLWKQDRPPADSLATLVEMALRLGGAPARSVWVLASEVWTQTITPSSHLVAGLSDEEISRALAFESEPLSGQSAFESLLGYVPVASRGGAKEFWISQVPSWQRDAVETVVADAGSTLAGILHPGGLPRPIGSDARETSAGWQRVELWPDAVVCLCGSPAKGVRVHVINADPRHGTWATQAQEWTDLQEATGDSETLVSTGDFAKSNVGGHRFHSLDEEETLRDWFAAWGSQLAGHTAAVPHLTPPIRPIAPFWRGLASAALAILVAAGCWTLHGSMVRQREDLGKQIEQVELPGKKKTQFEAEFKTQEKKRDEVKKKTGELEKDVALCEAAFEEQRMRLPALLRSLAAHTPEEVLVQKIEPKAGDAKISGLALRPEAAMELARLLTRDLAKQGWQIGAPKATAQVQLEDGGPWQFELNLRAPLTGNPSKVERDFTTE